jgi:hypothetical protein
MLLSASYPTVPTKVVATTAPVEARFIATGFCDHTVNTDNSGNMTKVSGGRAIDIVFNDSGVVYVGHPGGVFPTPFSHMVPFATPSQQGSYTWTEGTGGQFANGTGVMAYYSYYGTEGAAGMQSEFITELQFTATGPLGGGANEPLRGYGKGSTTAISGTFSSFVEANYTKSTSTCSFAFSSMAPWG